MASLKRLLCLFVLIILNTAITDKVIEKYFEKINKQLLRQNAFGAKITWDSSVYKSNNYVKEMEDFVMEKTHWQHRVCRNLTVLQEYNLLNKTEEREVYLLCRGAVYEYDELRKIILLKNQMMNKYNKITLCMPKTKENKNVSQAAILNFLNQKKGIISKCEKNCICLIGETDFKNMISKTNDERVLKFLWWFWRENALEIKQDYLKMIELENLAARRNGYTNIGAVWREELEIPNLRSLCRHLYEKIKPLYVQLHGVIRFILGKYYEDVPEKGGIPVHLLGSMWGENWSHLLNLVVASKNLEGDFVNVKNSKWSTYYMARKADDFYQSLGLPKMTYLFWNNSIFERNDEMRTCHGTAADMFRKNDFRLLYCSEDSFEDLYVIHHEMGHIQYFMAYEDQVPVFRQGTNSAFHESIGDAIMLGVLTPQNLNRLGLINDTSLFRSTEEQYIIKDSETSNKENKYENNENCKVINDLIKKTDNIDTIYMKIEKSQMKFDKDTNERESNNIKSDKQNISPNIENFKLELNTDEIFILKRALTQLPHISFALALDEYRWKIFEGSPTDLNNEFWDLVYELQGIIPIGNRDGYFDAGSIFHVVDNTPYIRYFLSFFIQHQLFEELCKTAVFGYNNPHVELPGSIPLRHCDIYGSRGAGKILKNIMSKGSSRKWNDILWAATHQDTISANSILKYYEPLYEILGRYIDKYNVPLGW